MKEHLHSWIADLGRRFKLPPTATQPEAGVLVPVNVILDQVGDDPDVALRRRWKEDCESYRLRLELFCQEEIIRREKYEQFLSLLLSTERG